MSADQRGTGLRPREQRVGVVIPSRMRDDHRWSDVCIRNISEHGLLIAAPNPPVRGSYVEIRRGTQIIVARSMWADGQYYGLRSQEVLPVEQIIAEPRLTSRPAVALTAAGHAAANAERRRDADRTGAAALADRQERSRRFASAFQFVLFAAAGAGVAGWAAVEIYVLLAAPAAAIRHALGG